MLDARDAGQIWATTEQPNCVVDLVSEVPSLGVFNGGGQPLLTPHQEQVVALVAEGLETSKSPASST
jgi:hypothetical protein